MSMWVELVLTSHHVGYGGGTQVVRASAFLLSHPTVLGLASDQVKHFLTYLMLQLLPSVSLVEHMLREIKTCVSSLLNF